MCFLFNESNFFISFFFLLNNRVHFPPFLFLPFSFQLIKCIYTRCNDVEMKCSCIEQAGCQLKQLLLSLVCLFLFYLQIWCWAEIKQKKKKKEKREKKRCELSVFSFVFVYTCTLSFLNADAPFQINLCTHIHTK